MKRTSTDQEWRVGYAWDDDADPGDEAMIHIRGPCLDLNRLPAHVQLFLAVALVTFLAIAAANGWLFIWLPWLADPQFWMGLFVGVIALGAKWLLS